MRDIIVTSAANEKKAHDGLVLVQRQAEERDDRERERTSHTHALREILQSLEGQSRQHQENILTIRNELTEDQRSRMKAAREEIESSHSKEIELLKARHEQAALRIQTDASEQEKLSAENAVACVRLEYEEKLSQQLASHNKECEDIKAETVAKIDRQVEIMKIEMEEVDCLRTELDVYVSKEKKLQLEVERLQVSLDSMSASNQEVITGLQEQNAELLDDSRRANGELNALGERINSLELEVRM